MPDPQSNDAIVSFVTIAEYNSLEEALVVQGLLASYGIAATVADENFRRLYGGSVHSGNGIPLQVRQVDAGASLEILQASQQPLKIDATTNDKP
ncbi:MAG TPA: hypothetical protein VHX63_12815 [Acidobacteriaceae bacterium]|jgi:hypothetical protein|nr:hypothetical protein [Acidobacteriaceae bacterium]